MYLHHGLWQEFATLKRHLVEKIELLMISTIFTAALNLLGFFTAFQLFSQMRELGQGASDLGQVTVITVKVRRAKWRQPYS